MSYYLHGRKWYIGDQMKRLNLKDERFGKLVALEIAKDKSSGANKWVCRCDCGNEVSVRASSLKSGVTSSCGCIVKENGRKTMLHFAEQIKLGDRKPTQLSHGLSDHYLYSTWDKMIRRCSNKLVDERDRKRYADRGITVCERWLIFQNFIEDMGERPKGYSLDRIDNNGNYEPSNCRWATSKQQANNTSRNQIVCGDGQSKTISEWAEDSGIKVGTLWNRLKIQNKTIGDALLM